jgi:aspartate 1-decarboxylase
MVTMNSESCLATVAITVAQSGVIEVNGDMPACTEFRNVIIVLTSGWFSSSAHAQSGCQHPRTTFIAKLNSLGGFLAETLDVTFDRFTLFLKISQ